MDSVHTEKKLLSLCIFLLMIGAYIFLPKDSYAFVPPSGFTYTCELSDTQSTITFQPWRYPQVDYYTWDIRIDDKANPWNGSCASPNPGDRCYTRVYAQRSTAITIEPLHTYGWTVQERITATGQTGPVYQGVDILCPIPTNTPTITPTFTPTPTLPPPPIVSPPSCSTNEGADTVRFTWGHYGSAVTTSLIEVYNQQTGALFSSRSYTNLGLNITQGIYVTSGTPYTWRIKLTYPSGQTTGFIDGLPFQCPAPTATPTSTPTPTLGMPSALWASCQNNSTQATVGWTAGANADAYYLRVDNQNNPWPDIPGGDVYEDNVVATSYDLPVTPDAPYSFWVHSRYDTGEFSAAEISSFVCATPPTPTPTTAATPTIVPGIVITGILSQQSGSSTTTIDTNGTAVATDDTYGTSTSGGTHPLVNGPDATDPAIITHQWTDSSGYIFISTWGSGLYLINSQNTLGTEDDTLIKVYSTLSSPPIASDLVYGSWLATTAPFTSQLYINTNGGLSVLNIGSVSVTNDDVVVGRYSTSSSPNGTPNIPSNYIDSSNMAIVQVGVGGPGGAYIYISTSSGLSVIDTQATAQTSDDALLHTYNSTSTPTLGTNDANDSLYISPDALYVGTDNGLSVIDVGSGIPSVVDDTITTHPLIPNGTAVNDLIFVTETNTLYVATEGGLYVINTNGTDTTTDDVLVHIYTTTSGAGESEPIVLSNNNANDIEYDPATDIIIVVTDPITRPIGNEVSLPSAELTIIPRPTTYYYPNIADGPCSSSSTSINTASNPQSFTSTVGLAYNPQTGAPCVVQDPSTIGFDILTTLLGYYNTFTLSNVQVASPNTTYNFDIPLSYSGDGGSWIKIVNGSFIRAPNKSTLTNNIPFVADRFLSVRSTQANIGTGDDDVSDTGRAVFIDETADNVAGVVTEVDMAPVAKRSPTNNWFVSAYETNTSLGANLTSYVAKLINKKSVNDVTLSGGTLTLAAGQINNLVQADATIDNLVISGTSNRGTVLVVSQDALGALANVTFSNNFNTTNPRKSLVIFAKNITVGGSTSDFGAVFIGTGTFAVNTRDDNGTTFLPSAVPLKISGDVIMSGGINQNRSRVRADQDNARPAMIIVSQPKMTIDTFALLAISE